MSVYTCSCHHYIRNIWCDVKYIYIVGQPVKWAEKKCSVRVLFWCVWHDSDLLPESTPTSPRRLHLHLHYVYFFLFETSDGHLPDVCNMFIIYYVFETSEVHLMFYTADVFQIFRKHLTYVSVLSGMSHWSICSKKMNQSGLDDSQ